MGAGLIAVDVTGSELTAQRIGPPIADLVDITDRYMALRDEGGLRVA